MDDETVLHWLIGMTTYIANLHQHIQTRPKEQQTNAGPRFHETNVREGYDEGFARWMGWRGEAEQEQEIRSKRKA